MFLSRLDKKSDEELMRHVQAGDSHAMTILYRRYSVPLLRYFYRMLWKEEALAQDALHDLFVKVIERSGQFDTRRKFSTWLYAAAHNMCKNEYRKMAFRNAAQTGSIVDFPADENIHQGLDEQAFMKTLDHLLDNMEEADKNLFVLRHELDLPLEEIARLLDCPVGTVKSRLFYLRKELAREMHMFDTKITIYGTSHI
ncbi:MAG TPA: sigma-70 family RNA polymerase sigma factor [Ohtaekwangia sp.]|nr:sigma-70 family RNA polymerase sigma factor [Ohtaekwangia sp.]